MADTDKEVQQEGAQPDEAMADIDESAAMPESDAAQKSKSDGAADGKPTGNMEFLLDIPLEISVELGRTKILINELLKLGQGSVLELSKLAGETLEILANRKLIARGEVVVVNEKYGIRLTEIISPSERIERLK
ncbi:MAG: flagellar motor switch protein FliN [Desulfobacterales bacterium]|jgi:flagellar motor switch protein FliN/FliY|nr:flagellar motor switch protein FliN [Desulfobacterales bacterium]